MEHPSAMRRTRGWQDSQLPDPSYYSLYQHESPCECRFSDNDTEDGFNPALRVATLPVWPRHSTKAHKLAAPSVAIQASRVLLEETESYVHISGSHYPKGIQKPIFGSHVSQFKGYLEPAQLRPEWFLCKIGLCCLFSCCMSDQDTTRSTRANSVDTRWAPCALSTHGML